MCRAGFTYGAADCNTKENRNVMRIAAMTFRVHAPWVHSLKEKRMIVKSIVAKLQNKFHVSAAEIDEQDIHQIIVIGVAAIVPHNAMPSMTNCFISWTADRDPISGSVRSWTAKRFRKSRSVTTSWGRSQSKHIPSLFGTSVPGEGGIFLPKSEFTS